MEKRKITLKGIWGILKASFTGFTNHKVTKLSGSLAYYTVFSMAPLLVVIITRSHLIRWEKCTRGDTTIKAS